MKLLIFFIFSFVRSQAGNPNVQVASSSGIHANFNEIPGSKPMPLPPGANLPGATVFQGSDQYTTTLSLAQTLDQQMNLLNPNAIGSLKGVSAPLISREISKPGTKLVFQDSNPNVPLSRSLSMREGEPENTHEYLPNTYLPANQPQFSQPSMIGGQNFDSGNPPRSLGYSPLDNSPSSSNVFLPETNQVIGQPSSLAIPPLPVPDLGPYAENDNVTRYENFLKAPLSSSDQPVKLDITPNLVFSDGKSMKIKNPQKVLRRQSRERKMLQTGAITFPFQNSSIQRIPPFLPTTVNINKISERIPEIESKIQVIRDDGVLDGSKLSKGSSNEINVSIRNEYGKRAIELERDFERSATNFDNISRLIDESIEDMKQNRIYFSSQASQMSGNISALKSLKNSYFI